MTTTNKSFLQFRDAGTSPSGRTGIFHVHNLSGMYLGEIRWHAPWRRYVFATYGDLLFDAQCMAEITTKILELMTERARRR